MYESPLCYLQGLHPVRSTLIISKITKTQHQLNSMQSKMSSNKFNLDMIHSYRVVPKYSVFYGHCLIQNRYTCKYTQLSHTVLKCVTQKAVLVF
jgi:hypothetical protein